MKRFTIAVWAWLLFAVSLVAEGLALLLAAISPYAAFGATLISSLYSTLPFAMAGVMIATRRPKNAIGWLLLVNGLLLALTGLGNTYAPYAFFQQPKLLPFALEVGWLAQLSWLPALALLVTFVPLLFPDSRLLSSQWRWVAWLAASAIVFTVSVAYLETWPERLAFMCRELRQYEGMEASGAGRCAQTPAVPLDDSPPLLILTGLVLLGLAAVASIISLFVRYRRAAGIERLQLKWFGFGTVVAVSGAIGAFLPMPQPRILLSIQLLAIPVTLVIAILRYRLWDIDIIIRRTLIYGTLTAVLAFVYFGTVVLLQQVFRPFFGAENDLAVVASTLAIAALFQPLRRRIQSIIDRRFYRRKYDAAKILQAYSARLRDEVELQTLREDLQAVVVETMQPAHVSLWLRQPERR